MYTKHKLPKMFTRLVAVVGVMTLSGCEFIEDTVTELLYSGTVSSVEACMRKNGSTLVSTETTQRACIEKHQSRLNKFTKNGEAKLTGKASLNSEGIDGKFNNKFHDAIITKVVFATGIFEGSTSNTYYADHAVWIEPNQHDNFNATYRNDVNITVPEKGCPEDGPEIDCWVWYISEVWGVKIK